MIKMGRILLGLLGVVLIASAGISYFQQGFKEAASGFIQAVNDQDMDTAYSYLSKGVAATTTKEALSESFGQKGAIGKLDDFKSWTRSTEGERSSLSGFAQSKPGFVVPIVLWFVEEEGNWKIDAIVAGAPVPTVPSEDELEQLVSESTLVFAAAVNERSMAKFHEYISALWQSGTTAEELDEYFAAFYEAGMDLTGLENHVPEFEVQPAVGSNGVLVLSGKYPVEPAVDFVQKYIFEDGMWKLIGFTITINSP